MKFFKYTNSIFKKGIIEYISFINNSYSILFFVVNSKMYSDIKVVFHSCLNITMNILWRCWLCKTLEKAPIMLTDEQFYVRYISNTGAVTGQCVVYVWYYIYISFRPSFIWFITSLPHYMAIFGTQKQIDREFLKRNSKATWNYINMRVHLAYKILKTF